MRSASSADPRVPIRHRGWMDTRTPFLWARRRLRMSLAALRLHHGRRSGDAVPELAAVDGSDPPFGMPGTASGRADMGTPMPSSAGGRSRSTNPWREGQRAPLGARRINGPVRPQGLARQPDRRPNRPSDDADARRGPCAGRPPRPCFGLHAPGAASMAGVPVRRSAIRAPARGFGGRAPHPHTPPEHGPPGDRRGGGRVPKAMQRMPVVPCGTDPGKPWPKSSPEVSRPGRVDPVLRARPRGRKACRTGFRPRTVPCRRGPAPRSQPGRCRRIRTGHRTANPVCRLPSPRC